MPTILEAIGIEAPKFVNTVAQEPIEGDSMLYSFDQPDAPTPHRTQYYEMLGNRGLIHDGWKIATYHGRKPWESRAAWSFDEDHWELYNLTDDPSECNDLMAGRDRANLDDPLVRRLLDLVSLWWAEAGKYQVLPLDNRFMERTAGRAGLFADRTKFTYFDGAVRIQEFAAPDTKNRSWVMTAEIEIPMAGAHGPIVVMGGSPAGWALYLNHSVPTFCYNFPGPEYTYIRGKKALPPGRHVVRFEFEKTGLEPLGAGGTGRLFQADQLIGEEQIPRTCGLGYSMDETFDVGWDKGTPVSEDYGPLARFTGKVIRVDFDLKPDLHPSLHQPQTQGEGRFIHAMVRQ